MLNDKPIYIIYVSYDIHIKLKLIEKLSYLIILNMARWVDYWESHNIPHNGII
jgi:hypothetical protein